MSEVLTLILCLVMKFITHLMNVTMNRMDEDIFSLVSVKLEGECCVDYILRRKSGFYR